jgi:tRNA(Ile)-lysidine synthase TilS/MesJ
VIILAVRSKIMLCRKCVLPEFKPDIYLNEDGICNICTSADRKTPVKKDRLLESDFVSTIHKYKGKGKYDCLVMCSGGKDSTASLYYMKTRYKMNPLVFTFDHGFENEEAICNIKNAVEILGVDWLFYRTGFIKDVFEQVIRENIKSPICHICTIWYIQLTYDIARRYKIPLIISGYTKGQSGKEGESLDAYRTMSKATSDFIVNKLRKNPKYKKFPKSIEEATRISSRRFKSIVVSPHWYLRWDPEEIKGILSRGLNWKAPKLSYPKGSTNCLMNFISVYLSMKHYGYTHYHIEASKLIREQELSREEALDMLAIEFDTDLLDSILKSMGICKHFG